MTPENANQPGSAPSRPSRIYSARLDDTMCPICAAHAGIEYPTEGLTTPTIPNPSCTHPEGCRCTWL